VEPAIVLEASSSFFENKLAFPAGTAALDCALVMRRVPVEWLPLERLDNADSTANYYYSTTCASAAIPDHADERDRRPPTLTFQTCERGG
jgi:hypothetical protein